MDELIQAVLKQDISYLKKNLSRKNINRIYDFSIDHAVNIHLLDGTEKTEYDQEVERGTLLHLAAWNNLPIAAKTLIEKGADVNAKDTQGRTPLEVAANRYDVITIPTQKVLIENKADMNFYVTKFMRNHPLLFVYIWDEQYELAKLAIENGADVNMELKDGGTILEFAERRGTPEIVSMIKAKGAHKKKVTVWVSGQQLKCCGAPFKIGDKIDLRVSEKMNIGDTLIDAPIDYYYGAHVTNENLFNLTGTVTSIYSRYILYALTWDSKTHLYMHNDTTTVCSQQYVIVEKADGLDKNIEEWLFQAYIVELDEVKINSIKAFFRK